MIGYVHHTILRTQIPNFIGQHINSISEVGHFAELHWPGGSHCSMYYNMPHNYFQSHLGYYGLWKLREQDFGRHLLGYLTDPT